MVTTSLSESFSQELEEVEEAGRVFQKRSEMN